MIYEVKIANIPIRFSGELNDAFLKRVSPYKYNIKDDENFILVNYTLSDNIALPDDRKTVKKISDREIFYDKYGRYCFADFNEQIEKYISKISVIDNVASIEMYSFNDEKEIELITKALREYKKTMPNPKEKKEAETAQFEPDMPLINSTDQAVRLPLLLNNVISIHSSAITYKNEGIIFSASSGTGKSTHTSLWKEAYPNDVTLINDDSPLVSINGEDIFLHGSPWAGASGLNENKSAPLKAIVFLEQAPENSIEKLPVIFALRLILNQIHIPTDKNMTDKTYTLLNLLLSSVPCYLLKCLPDTDAVETVKKAVFE